MLRTQGGARSSLALGWLIDGPLARGISVYFGKGDAFGTSTAALASRKQNWHGPFADGDALTFCAVLLIERAEVA